MLLRLPQHLRSLHDLHVIWWTPCPSLKPSGRRTPLLLVVHYPQRLQPLHSLQDRPHALRRGKHSSTIQHRQPLHGLQGGFLTKQNRKNASALPTAPARPAGPHTLRCRHRKCIQSYNKPVMASVAGHPAPSTPARHQSLPAFMPHIVARVATQSSAPHPCTVCRPGLMPCWRGPS
jgi:hypothetical protein